MAVQLNLADGLRVSTHRYPDKVAVIQGSRRATYRELTRRTNRLAHALAGLGLAHQDRVGILAHNVFEYVEIAFALAKSGLVGVPANPRMVAGEVQYLMQQSGARALITCGEYVESHLEPVRRELDLVPDRNVIVLGGATHQGYQDYEELLDRASDAEPGTSHIRETDLWFLNYTSGTTGLPKGAMITHRSRSLTCLATAAEYGCYAPEDTSLAIAPMFHGAGLLFGVAPVYFGGTVVVMPRFGPEEVLRLVQEHRVTNMFLVPTMFHAIFALPEATLAAYDHSSLTTIMSNAAPLPQATKERIIGYFTTAGLHELYGSTEGGIVTNLRPPDQLRKVQCVGHPFPLTEIRLLDDDGNEVGVGQVGELFSRSPYTFAGYWNMPEATAAAMRGDWFSAGDLAIRDEDNCYYIVDRKKDMIITGGVNVYPRDIEEVLFTHPGVLEAAVIGLRDDYWGEAVTAVVVPRPGVVLDEAGIRQFLDGKLAEYKQPKRVVFIDALPRNAAGKVLKRELRLSLADG